MSAPRRAALVVLIASLSASLSACGSAPSPAPAPGATDAASSATPAPSSAPAPSLHWSCKLVRDLGGSGYPGFKFSATNTGIAAVNVTTFTLVFYSRSGETGSQETTWPQLIEPGQTLRGSFTDQDEIPAGSTACQIPQYQYG